MLSLNDDCLSQIFGLLCLREQLILCYVCYRFRDVVVNLLWHSKFRELHTSSNTDNKELHALSNGEYQDLFGLVAALLERFVIADTKHLAFSSYLGRYAHRPELGFYVSYKFTALRELDVRDGNLHDGHVRLLAQHCPRLEVFRFSSDHVTGEHIHNMSYLRQLHAPKSGLSSRHLRDIVLNLPLTHLDVVENASCCLDMLNEVDACGLQELRISERMLDSEMVGNLWKLSNLRLLHVAELFQAPLLNGAIPAFLCKVGHQLVELKIYNTSSYTSTVNAIGSNLDQLTHLRRLHLNTNYGMERIQQFLAVPSLRELHLVGVIQLSDIEELLDCENSLEDLYLEGFLYRFPTLPSWTLALIERLQHRRRTSLTIHAQPQKDEAGNVERMIRDDIEPNEAYQTQNVIRIKLMKPQETSILVLDSFAEFGFKPITSKAS